MASLNQLMGFNPSFLLIGSPTAIQIQTNDIGLDLEDKKTTSKGTYLAFIGC